MSARKNANQSSPRWLWCFLSSGATALSIAFVTLAPGHEQTISDVHVQSLLPQMKTLRSPAGRSASGSKPARHTTSKWFWGRRLRNTSSPCSKFSLKEIGPTWLHDSEMSDNLPFCVVRNGPWMQAARQGRSPCDLASEAARLNRDL